MSNIFQLDQLDYYDRFWIKRKSKLTKEEIEIITEVFDKIDVINSPAQAFFYGSRFTCRPSVKDTDVDVAIFTSGDSNELEELLIALGFTDCDDYDSTDEFWSFRKDTVNFILFYNKDLFQSTLITADFVKFHNITDKDKRVEIFRLTDNITINARSFTKEWA